MEDLKIVVVYQASMETLEKLGIYIRDKGLTGSLKDELGDNAKVYHFSNEADMINKIVLGLTAKQYCDIHNIDRKKMRDHLSSKDLEDIAELEKCNEFLIRRGFSYKQREEELSEYHLSKLRKL